MRELKFRAWTRQNPPMPWSQKFVAMTGSGEQMIPIGGTFTGAWHVLGDDAEGLIIEQYTGLKDKNGKEIYEGDIVRWSFKVDRNSELTYTADAVKWESYAEEEWPYSTISGFTLPESEDGYEVIGNIHENPELLGDTDVTNKEEEK